MRARPPIFLSIRAFSLVLYVWMPFQGIFREKVPFLPSWDYLIFLSVFISSSNCAFWAESFETDVRTWPCSHGYDIVPFHFGPFQKVARRGVAFTRVREKNQSVSSKTGPEIGRYGKVNQKLERYDIVPFCSRVNRSSLGPLSGPVWFLTGDTKLVSMTTSNVEVEIGPNCTSLILSIVSSF